MVGVLKVHIRVQGGYSARIEKKLGGGGGGGGRGGALTISYITRPKTRGWGLTKKWGLTRIIRYDLHHDNCALYHSVQIQSLYTTKDI